MKKSFLKKLMEIGIIVILSFFILKTIFPTIPSLNQAIPLCKTKNTADWKLSDLPEKAVLFCKDNISMNTLYKTKFLNIKLTTSGQFKLRASLRYKNSELISTETLTAIPQNNNKTITLTFPLDRPTNPKLNRLVSDIDELIFFITELKNPEGLKFNIDEVYIN